MQDSDLAQLLSEPDAVLFRQDTSVRDRVMLFTIPLVFFNNEIQQGGVIGIGSAVLLKIGVHSFAITAGHCVAEKRGEIATSVVLHEHRFELKCRDSSYVHQPLRSLDFGYFEIEHDTAVSMESHTKLFLTLDRIEVLTRSECISRNDWMIVAGYPDDWLLGDRQSKLGLVPIYYASTLSGNAQAPPSPAIAPSPEAQVVDIWAPLDGNVLTTSNTHSETSLPNFAGVSGGACWLSGVRPNPLDWELSKIKLVGTHMGSKPNPAGDEERKGFHARECLIGHHLCLIASRYPHLKRQIYDRYPLVESFENSMP